uniref:Reverse transcriptase domain-containing protein n=1 Tax=Cacopsylla melanoneura TaxID=428564 RepID=A0A8D8SUP8_9HEMI
MSSVLKSHNLTLDTKTRLLKCYVFSVLLYGVETWTLTEATTNKLKAFELWLYRRMLRISWTQKITNAEVLNRMNKKAELVNIIKARKLQYLGHIMRNEHIGTICFNESCKGTGDNPALKNHGEQLNPNNPKHQPKK